MKLPRELKIYGEIVLISLGIYFIITSVVPSSGELLLWVLASITLLTVPLAMPHKNRNEKVENRERVIVRNDLAHFRKVVEKALKGNPVAQRDVELELLNVLYIDLRIRYSLSEEEIRRKMGQDEFMKRYLGENWRRIKSIYERRHDLRQSVPREEFLKDINAIMEVMG